MKKKKQTQQKKPSACMTFEIVSSLSQISGVSNSQSYTETQKKDNSQLVHVCTHMPVLLNQSKKRWGRDIFIC